MTTESNARLEGEIEEIRERLAGTIDQLLYRANPKTITHRQVNAVKAHYVDPMTGQPRTTNIVRTVAIVGGVIGAFALLRTLSRR